MPASHCLPLHSPVWLMRSMLRTHLLLFLLVFCCSAAGAQDSSPSPASTGPDQRVAAVTARPSTAITEEARKKREPLRLARFENPPVIDAKLDDEAWQKATVLKDFYQTNPGDNTPPSFPTEVLIGYDSNNLYLGFRVKDDPNRVRATVAKRDNVLGTDDHVRVLLDTFNDKRRAYVFIFNPFGVQQDGIRIEGSGVDYTVDVVMESKGTLTEDGYVVEAAIPFKSLRYAASADKLWGIHVFRAIQRLNNEEDSWVPISRDYTSLLGQAGHITGFDGISGERTLELIPSITLSENGKRVSSFLPPVPDPNFINTGRLLNEPVKADLGLTAKYGITPTVTLDLALNPDFAQVEADQLVVTANQRFPIFYPEKRPFFLEGKEIFSTPLNAVNTRAIVDPDLAVKLSGKHGRNSFGILLASDNAPGNFSEEERTDPGIRPGIEKFLDKNAYIGVLRLKRDIGKESNLGLLFTSYNFIERHNQLGGIDGRFRLGPQTVLTFQALGTTSRRFFFDPDAGRNIYRADVGFTRRVNTNSNEAFFRYESDPNPKARLISYGFAGSGQVQYDWQGRTQGLNGGGRAFVNLTRQTAINGGVSRIYERLFEEEFGVK